MNLDQQGDMVSQLQAGRAVLLFLRAAILESGDLEGIRIGLGDPMSSEQAARELSKISKPVRCSASISDGVMVVTHEPREEPGTTDWMGSPHWIQTAVSMTTDDQTPEILLLSDQDTLLISRATLQVLAHDYFIAVPYSVSGDSPSPDQIARGIRWVVAVGTPAMITTDVNDLGLPEDLRSVIALEYERSLAEHSNPTEGREPPL